MKKIFNIATILVAFFASSAQAADYYVSGTFGAGKSQIESRYNSYNFKTKAKPTVFSGEIAIGAFAAPQVRTELAFGFANYQSRSFKYKQDTTNIMFDQKAKLNNFNVMANAYFDFTNTSPITPYLMVGAGYARNKFSVSGTTFQSKKKSTNDLALQAGAGFTFNLGEQFKVGLGYRYVSYDRKKYTLSSPNNGTQTFKAKPAHMGLVSLRVEM